MEPETRDPRGVCDFYSQPVSIKLNCVCLEDYTLFVKWFTNHVRLPHMSLTKGTAKVKLLP